MENNLEQSMFLCHLKNVQAEELVTNLKNENIQFIVKSSADGFVFTDIGELDLTNSFGYDVYVNETDYEKAKKISDIYQESAGKKSKSFWIRFAETAAFFLIAILLLTVYVCGIDQIIEIIKNLF